MRERTTVTRRRGTIVTGLLGAGAVFAFGACNSLDEPSAHEGSRTIVPIDIRPAQQALTKLPAISGGTLAASPDPSLHFAVAADPDRDRVSILNLDDNSVRHIALNQGDEPGRVVIDAAGHAYVALRRAGDVARINIVNAELEQRTHVCAAPRGMALDPLGLIHVACADGRLTTLNASDGSVTRELDLNTDLRDVMVRGEHLLVSTFKGAQLLAVDKAGTVVNRTGAIAFDVRVQKQVDSVDPQVQSQFVPQDQHMRSHLAWRTLQQSNGSVVMLHQAASQDEVDITEKQSANEAPVSSYGGVGGATCSGIVTPALTHIDSNGQVSTLGIAMGPVTVDMAVSSKDSSIAVVQAGAADDKAPRPSTVFDEDELDGAPSGFASRTGPPVFGVTEIAVPEHLKPGNAVQSSVMVFNPGGSPMVNQNCQLGGTVEVPGQATAVTYTANGELLVQSREPALITRVQVFGTRQGSVVELGGASVLDSGHEIFHRDAGGGIACASCHAEGAEDGHTWRFTGLGERRTQALHVGLAGTAPFHWSGDERDLGHLMEDVFVGRMGGVHQSGDRLDALTHWLFALQPPAPSVDAHAAAAVRGKALFESASTGCTNCHTGDKFTNSKTVDVGTGGMFQVPSLVGIGYRAPLMHTGCAQTLADRFNAECGGSKHGTVDNLSSAEVDDMVAYLRTL